MTESKQYKAEESNKWGITTTDKPIPTTISKFDILEKITKAHEVDLYNLRQSNRELKKQIKWERDIAIQQLNELGYQFGEKIRSEE